MFCHTFNDLIELTEYGNLDVSGEDFFMNSIFDGRDVFENLKRFSNRELKDLVYAAANWNALLWQIVLVKCAIKTSKKEVGVLKNIIKTALAYERPSEDPDWGNYGTYLEEIQKSILLLKDDLSVFELKAVLTYLKEQAEDDEVIGEFDADGEWAVALEEIEKLLLELEK